MELRKTEWLRKDKMWHKLKKLEPKPISEWLSGLKTGRMQSAGYMQVIPLLGPDCQKAFGYTNDIDISIPDYGHMTFHNELDVPVLVPAHTTVMVNGPNQDHAMTHAALIPPKSERNFQSAACIQAHQTGLLARGNYQTGLLPYSLREHALATRYLASLDKLWKRHGMFNQRFGLRKIGRLRYFLNHFRHEMDEFVAEFEPVPGQRGAIVLVEGRVAGVECGPTRAWWLKYWEPMIRGCYAGLAVEYRNFMGRRPSAPSNKIPLDMKVRNLKELRSEIELIDRLEALQVGHAMADLNSDQLTT
ncbi:MAG: DUF6569 family protein, partial [Bacteroidota bacterium]